MAIHNINGIHVVTLSGNWREMGRQYGQLADTHLHHVYDYVRKKALVHEDGMERAIPLNLYFE